MNEHRVLASMESSNLSSDMCYEILTRTSLKTLDRCKLVCKTWKYLTYESNFMPLHCQRTNTISGYFIQPRKSFSNQLTKFVSINHSDHSTSNLSLHFLPKKVNILASSNQGILCCVSGYGAHSRYYVCKPTSRQFEVIPKPKIRFKPDLFALVVLQSNPLRYKIVRLSCPKKLSKKYYNYRCEIFDSQTWRWKDSKEILLPNRVLLTIDHPVVLGGAIHWLMTNNCVLTFYVEQENYTIFSLPKLACDDDDDDLLYQHKQLVEYKGRLGFICELPPNGDLGLWVLEDCKKYAWDKVLVLNIDGALKREEPLASIAALYNPDIALMKGFNSTIFYKFLTRSFDVVKLDYFIQPIEVFPFRSDLEPVDFWG